MADEGFHEIQLSGKHLVALFMAATVVAVVIFLCGVAVGRGVLTKRNAEAAAEAAEMTADPTAPPTISADGPPAASAENLSYPERLASGSAPPETLKPEANPPTPVEVPPPPPRETPPPTVATVQKAPGPPPGDGFAVQVAAVRERSEADTIANRLATKGYGAYVMAPVNGAPRVFRVRVGKFKDRREAERVATRLEREEQFKPWITR